MNITENYSGHAPEELFALAGRENNAKRSSLIVNRFQGKHIPAKPSAVLELFRRLSDRVPAEPNTAVIGFAETATAIGAALAENLHSRIYIHTSRENIPEEYRLISFSEEHSHAAEQNLFSDKGKDIFSGIKRIVFAEDEITTGKTIRNLAKDLKKLVDPDCKFCAASIINGMSKDDLKIFADNGIELYWLLKIENVLSELTEIKEVFPQKDIELSRRTDYSVIEYDRLPDPRLGVEAEAYISACKSTVKDISLQLSDVLDDCKDLLFIGTEEFMYPTIQLALDFENSGCNVLTHSTTRSPIVPSIEPDYPLNERIKLYSFYDRSRVTYLYNISKADAAVVFTDTENFSEETAAEFDSVMKAEKVIFLKCRQKNEVQKC